jgi:hypothetical protein
MRGHSFCVVKSEISSHTARIVKLFRVVIVVLQNSLRRRSPGRAVGNVFRRASFQAAGSASVAAPSKARYVPARLADQNNSLSSKSKIRSARLGPVEAASGATNAEGWRRDVQATAAPLSFVSLPKGVVVKPESTVLSSFQENGVWRVRIEWPNGAVHYFGRFTSEKEALQWIDDHTWLTIPATKNTGAPRHDAEQPSSTGTDEQQDDRA